MNDLIALANKLGDDEILIMIGNMKNSDVKSLPKKIIYIPSTNSQQELSCFYNLADVVVSASYAESFGLTIVEALACGTPVIVYNNTGQADIPSENTGLLVETGDIEALADAIHKMKEHPLSPEACCKRAEEHFDKDKCFEEYIELYNRILK